MMQDRNTAVSPVVGVMLMLVVTIIIAAVVSAFAGGIGTEQHKTPQVTVAAKSVIQDIQGTTSPDYPWDLTYPDGYTAANGVRFENTGGDTFSLNDIEIQLQTGDTSYTIRPTDKVRASDDPDYKCVLPVGISNGGYFQKVGNTSVSDRMIAPGDMFMLYADGNSKEVTYSGGYGYYGPKISWRPQGAENGFSVYLNTKVQYKIIDLGSGRVMTSGELIVA